MGRRLSEESSSEDEENENEHGSGYEHPDANAEDLGDEDDLANLLKADRVVLQQVLETVGYVHLLKYRNPSDPMEQYQFPPRFRRYAFRKNTSLFVMGIEGKARAKRADAIKSIKWAARCQIRHSLSHLIIRLLTSILKSDLPWLFTKKTGLSLEGLQTR
jgi:hypothetical protein